MESPAWNKPEFLNSPEVQNLFQPFVWKRDQESSEENTGPYMTYLRSVITWPEGHELVDTSSTTLFTKVIIGSSLVTGSIDVILVDNDNVRDFNLSNNIRLGIELKKKVIAKNHSQACIEHLCASKLNNENTVLTVLTDLNETWFFVYFGSGRRLRKLKTSRREAKYLLDNMFNQADEILFPVDFVNRLTWNDFFSERYSNDNNNGDDPEGKEDGNDEGGGRDYSDGYQKNPTTSGQKSLAGSKHNRSDNTGREGGNVNGAAMLQFGGDVANELDLLDFIDNEEERTQIEINYVLQHIVPLFNFPEYADEKETWSSSSSSSSQEQDTKNNEVEEYMSTRQKNVSALSEQNLLYHNATDHGNMWKSSF